MKRAQAQTNAVPKRTGHLFKWNIYSKLRNPFFILEYYYFCPRIPTYPVFFNIFFTRWFLIWKFQKQKWREMQIPFLQQTGKCKECSLSPFTRYAYWYSSRPTQSWQTAWVWKFKVLSTSWCSRQMQTYPQRTESNSCRTKKKKVKSNNFVNFFRQISFLLNNKRDANGKIGNHDRMCHGHSPGKRKTKNNSWNKLNLLS